MDRLPSPVTTVDLVKWAYFTFQRERRKYEATPRPLTWERVRKSLRPSIRRPVFIVGAPRSGTSFLGRCLGALPELSYHFEPAATQRAAQYVYHGLWSFERAERFYRTVYRWLLRLHLDGDLRYADKAPRNSFIMSFLRRAFPEAQFVHIIRDGRDAALSHSKKPWLQAASATSGRRGVGGHRYGPFARFYIEEERVDEFETTSDYHRCIWVWRRHVEAVLHAKEALAPAQYHELRYERLVRGPEEEGERLLDFLGITDPASRARLLERARTARADSVGRWRRALTPAQRQTAEEEAGAVLRTLGYRDASVKAG